MPSGRITRAGVMKLVRLIRSTHPVVVQTWMYHADLVGGLAARFAGVPVCWGIRNAYLDAPAVKTGTRIVASTCALLSYVVPNRIVSCSRFGSQSHIARGYNSDKFAVIPNGYDSDVLRPDAQMRKRMRAELGIPCETFLLGTVARWDAQKDHGNLIAALGILRRELAVDWKCLLVGAGLTPDNAVLSDRLHDADVADRVILCGARSDAAALMNALDLHVLPSRGEGFPNVVAEAMACGVPCVVTDVGDAALIVGDTGWVVPPRDPAALARAIGMAALELADPDSRAARRMAARARVIEEFNIDRMVTAYQQIWTEVRA
jgi:glycosyltransferase involved in cell wall biosynthesis